MTIQHRSPVPLRALRRTLAALLVGSCFGASLGAAQAAPATPQVVSGQATFLQQGNVFSITNTPNTVINWQSFNVGAGEVTRFIQQSGDSAVLNRIVGHDPSQILGALQSNGRVFLINPNGILFGRDSRVDVNGLTASTLAMSDADFRAGNKRFGGAGPAGAIVNQGSITTPSGGQVFLIASQVENSGIITSPQGQVVLAAGHSVQLVDSSNPSLQVVVSAPADQSVNLGQIIAQGGKVGIYGALVGQRGVVNANSAHVGANGKIVLRASGDAMLGAGSVTSATGAGNGGEVSVEGRRVAMLGDASIDVSGVTGGGSALVGGGYQGRNPLLKNAWQTLMGKQASIRADAIDSGNGGTVVLWSDASTRALGQISARGGNTLGNGGLVETSGKTLDVNGIGVRTGARNGANGTWLLDPYDIIIANSEATTTLADVDQFADPGSVTFLNTGTINSVASGTNIVLQATHDVTFADAINPLLGAGSLKVDAGNNINVNAAINTGGGGLWLNANHPDHASATGAVVIGPGGSVDTKGGSVTLNGAAVVLGGPVMTRDGNMTINGGSNVRFEQNVATGNGHLTVTGNEIAFAGTGTSASGGYMLFNNVGGGFTLGPNWTLSSHQSINIYADSMSLFGNIGPSQMIRPVVNLRTYAPARPIDLIGGTGASTVLALDPARLMAFDAQSIHIGSPGYSGNISVLSEYNGGLASALTLQTRGNIVVDKPLILPTKIGSSLALLVEGDIHGSAITTAADTPGVPVLAGGHLGADQIELQANNMSIGAPIKTSADGHVSLSPHMPTGQIMLGAGALDGFDMLGLLDTELKLISTRELSIGGNPGQMGGLSVTAGGVDFTPMLPLESQLMLIGGQGNVTLNGKVTTPGTLFIEGHDLRTAGIASAKADLVLFKASFGIGGNGSPFVTETGKLGALNERIGGLAPINISNTGELIVGSVHQKGAGNEGSITIANLGGMTVIENDPGLMLPTSIIAGGKGGITLKTQSPLSIFGDISTQDGPIVLEAGNGGVLKIGPGVEVASVGGNIGLTGGHVINDGAVSTTTGNITIAAPTVGGSGTYAAPGGAITGLPAPVPSVGDCIVNAAIAGCTAVLKVALDACIVTPAGPHCLALLPSLAVCTAAPATYGCGVVLPTLTTCIATPDAAGCSAVLPPLPVCIATPAKAGCSVVLPTLKTCIVNVATAGCSVVLPTLPVCIATPAQAGCSVVLPTLPVCVSTPDAAGCSAVLPPLMTCIAAPGTPGCSVVLPSLSSCTLTPATEGCSIVLPTLAQCVDSPSLQGCTAVLPTLAECAANPKAAGCAVVLLPLTATPNSELDEALKTTIAAVDRTSDAVVIAESGEKKEKKDDSVSAGADSVQGDKPNDIAKKTYCN